MDNSYVLFDLDDIIVNTRTINSKTLVFCESIKVKQHGTQNIDQIEDWSNIIIGDPNKNRVINENGYIEISYLKETNGEYSVQMTDTENIGLWSVILFKTTTNDDGEYTELKNINVESAGSGGTGTIETNIKVVYEHTLASIKTDVNSCVYNFLENIFNTKKYNGCILIDNDNCGLFLNISPIMFNAQTELQSISLTNTITYIDSNKGLTSVGVFSDCDNLESANIPRYLDYYYEYNTITKLYDKVKSSRDIPTFYFYKCKNLENITIPDGIHNIGYAAFYGCDKVETIDIPSSVISIGTSSLVTVNMSSIRYINVNGDNSADIRFFEQSVGYDNFKSNDETPHSANDIIINIENRDVVTLSGSTAYDNTSFVKNISSNSKIYINCKEIKGTQLTTYQGQQKYIGGFVNTKFNTIYIGPDVQTICDFAFYNVTGTNLIINNDNEVLNKDYWDNSATNNLKDNVDGTYLVKTPFAKSKFNNIDILNCSRIGDYALHSLICNNLTFYDKDDIFEINDDNVITNSTTLTTLSYYAFYNSVFNSIIIIPSSVTSISDTSFLQTKGSLVLNCNISKYVTDIDESDKKHTGILVNSNFGKITFNYTGSIPENILYENKSINSIELGEGITEILGKAFYLCTNLTNTLSLPANLSSIDETAFIGCTFSKFEADSSYFKTANNGMYLLTGNRAGIVLFANKHSDIQITDNTFNIVIETVNKICGYAFAYAFSDYANSNVYAVTIPDNITRFGRNVFYNCQKLTRITFYPKNIAKFTDVSTSPEDIEVNNVSLTVISVEGSFSDLPLLKDVYIGYATGIILSDKINTIPVNGEGRTNFLYNTIRNSYTNNVSDISNITIYVYEDLVETYKSSAWGLANYKISGIAKDVPPPPPVPPTGNDDSYDADIDDPEGEEWPWDGGNGDIITDEEDYIPPVWDGDTTTGGDDSWITHENNVFTIPIKQLGTPAINVYGCRLDLLNLTDSYSDDRISSTPEMIVDQFGNIDFSALDYLKFNKVSNETKYGSEDDKMLKLYMGDYGNNFLIVFTVTGIDNFDATTNLFTSGVEYATHRESNWLKTEIVRITKKQKIDEFEANIYYVVLLCTCLKLQNKDNYNCRTAIVSVNYGSQILDSNINNPEQITTKIKVIQHKTELRLSNDTREINITDLPILFCQQTERTTFTGNFFIGFPKNFWGNGKTITNTQKLREYINDYFRILYDKEKIQIVGQVITINEIEYTYTFDVADEKYANIKATGSTTGVLKKFDSCSTEELNEIHEEYYYVNFKIKNLKTTLAGGVWNISIYNIGEPAEMLNIHVIEDQTDIPSIMLFSESVSVYGKKFDGDTIDENAIALQPNACYSIYDSSFVALNYFIPIAITNLPIVSNTIIYPNAEVIDLCVDSSCIIDCGNEYNTIFGTGSGDLLFNNYRGVLTLNTNSTTQPKIIFPISSSKLKHVALSSIKYTDNKNIQNTGLYSYFNNSEAIITDCSCTKNITKIKYVGAKDDSDILENTTAFLYEFNTGVSCIKQTTGWDSQTQYLYNNFLSKNENTLIATDIDDSNSNIAYHDENYERKNNLCVANNGKLVYDKFYNVLAPLYPYSSYTTKYKTNYGGTTQILVNNFYDDEYVQLIGDSNASIYKNTLYTYIENDSTATAMGSTYYCTSTHGIIITVDSGELTDDKFNIYTGQAYLVTDDNNVKINIGVDTSTGDYTKESTNNAYMNNTSIYSNASTVTLHPLYKISTNSLTSNVHSEISSTLIKEACSKLGITLKHGYVVQIIRSMNISFTPNNTSNLVVYEINQKYYDIYGKPVNPGNLYTCTETNVQYDKWVYISDSSASSFRTTYGVLYNYTEVFDNTDNIVVGEFNKMTTDQISPDKRFERSDSIYDNAGDINKTPTITPTPFITNSLNIGNSLLTTYNKSVDQTRFRQVFLNFYYSILDNGVQTKVYADNTDGILMHLRLINNYEKTIELPVFTTPSINIFNFSFNSTSSDVFNGSKPITPVYPIQKI